MNVLLTPTLTCAIILDLDKTKKYVKCLFAVETLDKSLCHCGVVVFSS